MGHPLVSIIIPVFNAEKTLGRAITSILNQSYPNTELIVVDGQSSDQSLQIALKHKRESDVVLSEPDTGVYDAVNKGLDAATGEWIFVLGADDYLANDQVLQHVFTKKHNGKLIFGSVKNLGVNHRLVPEIHKSKFGKGLYWRNTLHQQSAFYHASLFQNFRFDEKLKVLGDYDFHLFLMLQKTTYQEVNELVAICEASGLSKTFNTDLYREELRMKRKCLPPILFVLNIPLVWAKYLRKKLF